MHFAEGISFGTVIVDNIERYFEMNENRTVELSLSEGQRRLIRWKRRSDRFLNAKVVKLLRFSNNQMVVSNEQPSTYWFEITFKHSTETESLEHECVHWDAHHQ